MSEIRIADFSAYPAGRDDDDGPNNGTRFRRSVLLPAIAASLKSGDQVNVVLDGVMSYGSSFLEEAFGGLIRVEKLMPADVQRVLRIVASGPVYQTYKRQIEKHLREAASVR